MNQQTPSWLLATILVSAFSLAACNSSSGDGAAQNDDQGNPQNGSDTEIAFSGKVADGYIVGATVCLDINRNALCDGDEPTTVSSGGGNYTLEFDQSLVGQYPVVVEVGTAAYDEDTGDTFDGPFRLSAPAGSGGFVSPLTTLVAGRMGMNPDMSTEEAEAAVLEAMGFGSGTEVSLFEDYIERGDETDYQVQHRVSQALTKLFVAAEIRGTELEASGELSGYSTAQRQQVIADVIGESLADIATAASESSVSDDVVGSWLQLIDQVDGEAVAARVARAELVAASNSIDLMGFIESENVNGFYFSNDNFYTWTSSLTETGELVFTEKGYDTAQGDFLTHSLSDVRLLISEAGELIRSKTFSDMVTMVDDYPEMNGVQLLTFVEDSEGSLHRLEELLLQGRSVPVSGSNLWETLSAIHPTNSIQSNHESLFDADATMGESAKAVLVERRPIGEPAWTISHSTNCSANQLADIAEVNEPDLEDNCSVASLQGLDWRDTSSNTMTDVFNDSAYIPDADPVKNNENLDEEVSSHVMVEMGEHRGRPFTETDGVSYGKLLAELVGSVNDQSGAVNWYLKQSPLTRYIKSDTVCQNWEEVWAQVNGNCYTPTYLEYPLDEEGVTYVPSVFSDLIVDSPMLGVGEKVASQLLNNYGEYQAIVEVMEYRENETYEGLEGSYDYSVNLAGELLGSEGDTGGSLVLYEVTRADTVGFSRWVCNDDDERASIEALSGNCALASNFDYSSSFSLSDQMISNAQAIDTWTLYSEVDDLPFYDMGNLNLRADESCGIGYLVVGLSGFMIGSPEDDTGTFQVMERATLQENGCTDSVRELAKLTWNRLVDDAGNVYYEIDINSIIDSGDVESFHGDWDHRNPGSIYLAQDGEVLRPAQLRVEDTIAERIAESGNWEKETIDGRETISFEIPDSLKTEDWHRVEFSLIEDNGVVRQWWWDEQDQIEALNISSEWTMHELGDERVVEIERPGLLGVHMWGQGITDVGTRIRRVNSHLGWLKNDNQSFQKRTWYSSYVIEQVQSQVRDNYSTWAAGQTN
jgi:hypothetical protein